MHLTKQSLILTGAVILATMAKTMGTIADAQTASDAPSSAASTFKANCAICHGDNGAGSPLGIRLHTPDLRSSEIHKKAPAALAHSISAGKNNMPAFAGKLSGGEIEKLVEYVRHLHEEPDGSAADGTRRPGAASAR